MREHKTHLAYLSKKCYEFSVCLNLGVVKWTQHGVHNNWGVIGKLDDIEQLYAMIFGIRYKGLCREKLVNLELIGTLFFGEHFQHHWSPVGDASCVHAYTQLKIIGMGKVRKR